MYLYLRTMNVAIQLNLSIVFVGITCLIQVTTTEGGDFIIDALAIREHIHKLNLAFTDPKKLKVSLSRIGSWW